MYPYNLFLFIVNQYVLSNKSDTYITSLDRRESFVTKSFQQLKG